MAAQKLGEFESIVSTPCCQMVAQKVGNCHPISAIFAVSRVTPSDATSPRHAVPPLLKAVGMRGGENISNFFNFSQQCCQIFFQGMLMCAADLPAKPQHFALLSADDAIAYNRLHCSFQQCIRKSARGERVAEFQHHLDQIRAFIQRTDTEDWKRSLVCGVIFLDHALCINIQQLRILIGRCKSSINGSLQMLGYSAQPQIHGVEIDLSARIPGLQLDIEEIKKWSVRRLTGPGAQPPVPLVVPLLAPREEEKSSSPPEKPIPCPVKCRYKSWQIPYDTVAMKAKS
jgi:hypothetical protein